MAADNKLTYVLDLDAQKFFKAVGSAVDGVDGLKDALKAVSVPIAVVTTAILAMKSAFELTKQAEQLRAIERQFKAVSSAAGIAGEEILGAMEKASGGLIDSTELMKMATSGIIELGDNAKRMGEIMDLSLKIASVSGQELSAVFETLSNALASGNARALRQYGIFVEADTATKNYADSLGVVTSALSQAGQKQAIFNAALEEGQKRYAEISPDLDSTTSNMTRLANAGSDLYDSFAKIIDAQFGDTIRGITKAIAEQASGINDKVIQNFGSESEAAAATVRLLEADLKQLQAQFSEIDKQVQSGAAALNAIPVSPVKRILEEQISAKQFELQVAKDELSSLQEIEAGAETDGVSARMDGGKTAEPAKKKSASGVDYQALKAMAAAFQNDLIALETARINASLQNIRTLEQADQLFGEKQALAYQALQAQLSAIDANKQLDQQQKNAEKEALMRLAAEQEIALVREIEAIRAQSLQNNLDQATNVSAGISAAFQKGANDAARAQQNFGQIGNRVYTSFSNNAVSALQAFGAGSKSAAEAAKGFLFGMLADEAEARGKLMLLASIWPPNPAGLAGGAALIALSGWLRSQGGSGGGGGGGGGAGAGGAGGGNVSAGATTDTRGGIDDRADPSKNVAPKAVSLVIQGNLYETEQTRQRLVEMVRESSDATDFNIKGIG